MDGKQEYVESLEPDQDDYQRLEHVRRHRVEPGAPMYVTVDDVILVQSWAPLAATAFRVSLRVMVPRGEIVPYFFTFTALAQGATPTLNQIKGVEGYIISASIDTATGQLGAVFVSMLLQRGVGSSDLTHGQLLVQGYPSPNNSIGYPQTHPVSNLHGRALLNVITEANPAAGADYSFTVPAGVTWLLRSLRLQFQSSATVANRFVTLRLDDGLGNIFCDSAAGAAQAASTTETYTWFAGAPSQNTNLANTGALPDECRLPASFRIRTNTANIQAADQFTGLAMLVETFMGT